MPKILNAFIWNSDLSVVLIARYVVAFEIEETDKGDAVSLLAYTTRDENPILFDIFLNRDDAIAWINKLNNQLLAQPPLTKDAPSADA